MTRDEIFALFSRREAAWHARDAASLTADHSPTGVVVSPTGGVLEGRARWARMFLAPLIARPELSGDALRSMIRRFALPALIQAT